MTHRYPRLGLRPHRPLSIERGAANGNPRSLSLARPAASLQARGFDMRWKICVALLLPLLLAACGKTAADIIAENKAKVDAVRATLASALSALPPPGESVSAKGGEADPKPDFEANPTGSPTGNVAFVAPEEIKGGEAPAFDILLQADLNLALAWAGPNNPMSDTAMSGPENKVGEVF